MNIKQKKVLRVILACVMLIAILVPVASNLTGKAASWTVNSCYKVNVSAGLAIKNTASDSASTVATIPNGTVVYVMCINSSNWGFTRYNGKEGWIKLSNAMRLDGTPESVAELHQRFEALMSFYPNGTKWKGSTNVTSNGEYKQNNGGQGPWECFGFAAEVWRALFGTEMAIRANAGGNKIYEFRNPPASMKMVGQFNNNSKSDMIALLSKARCGDIIQGVNKQCINKDGQSITTSSGYTGQHTMVVYSVESDGITVWDANNPNHDGKDNVVQLFKYPWDVLYNERGGAMSLYTSSAYPPEKVLPVTGGNITTKNSSNAAVSDFYLGDTIKFSASISNAKTVTYYVVNKSNGNTIYTGTEASYVFKTLDSGNSYYVYYVAKNSAYEITSEKTNFTVKTPTVSITTGNISLESGKTATLKATGVPTSNVKFNWTTKDPTVATVNQSGVVTAVKKGKVQVTVTLTYTGTSGTLVRVTDTVTVTVTNPSYMVSFDVNGGDSATPSSITVVKTEKYGKLPVVSKKGHQFLGWYTAKTGGTKITEDSIVSISSNTTLYAHWTPYKYKITFIANGGTLSSDGENFLATYGEKLGKLPTAVRPGYVFEGWYTENTGGTRITENTVHDKAYAITYFAHWSLAEFNVKFDAAGGKASATSIKVTYTKTYGQLPTATRTGYVFGGWFTGKNGTGTQITASSEVKITADTTLYAKWTANKYTVSFDTNRGEGKFDSVKVTFGSAYGNVLPVPVRAGYSFVGWYTELNGGKLVTGTTNVSIASDHTLYARWEPGKFVVTFDANGGQVSEPNKTVTYSTVYGILPVPSRVGYTFAGWFTSKTGGDRITGTTKVEIVDAQTLYAHWTVNTYEISFDTDSESRFNPISVTFDTAFGELPIPEKRGYTFVGWFTSEKHGTQMINASSVLKIGENTTLYAHWQANTYKITFDPALGSVDIKNMDVVFGSPYGELPKPIKFGYEFLGWYTEGGRNGTFVDSSTIVDHDENIVLYAHWSAKRITVTFDANNGTCDETAREYEFDTEFGSFPIPSRTGYTFIGWMYKDGEYLMITTVVDFVDDVSVTAQWKANAYTVELDCNGGSIASNGESTSFDVVYDSVYPQIATPARQGYRFVGWQTEDATFVYSGEIVKITSSQTLVAQWAPIVYVVEFDTDGGDMEATFIRVGYAQPYGKLPTPIKKGYSFAGWMDENGSIVDESSAYGFTSSTKLTAKWTERIYIITFDPNGGQMSYNVKLNVKYGQQYGELPIPSRTGYKFTRWVDKDGNAIHETSTVTVADDTMYYAEWVPLIFDVEFDVNGSDMTVPPISVTYGETYDILPEIERNGYSFEGWYDQDGNLVVEDSVVEITSHAIFTAHWTAREYTLVFDPNGGECDVDRIDFTFDKLGRGLPIASKEGCIFVGWYGENGKRFTNDTALVQGRDNIITARWAKTEYSIYFNVQGTINSTITKVVEYGNEIGMLPSVNVYGYEFVCWQHSNGKVAEEKDVYTDVSDTVLYAVLIPGEYTLSFYAEGGEPEFVQKQVVNGEVFGALPQTVRHGYALVGWFTEDGIRITEDTVANIDDDMNVHARWAKIESDTDGIFRNNSMLATSCEIFAAVDLVLLLLTMLKKRKKKEE